VFYIILFSALAVLLVVTGLITISRRRSQWEAEERHQATTAETDRRKRKATRAQSRQDRRKRK
jgi:hypothetical protein